MMCPTTNSAAFKKETEAENDKLKKKYTRTQWLTTITLAFGNFCVGGSVSLQSPFFPREAEHKGATPTEYGLIFGIFQLTIFITAPLMAKLIKCVEPKFLLNFGAFTNGLACTLFGLLVYVNGATTFVTLAFAIRMLEGMGAAALRTSAYAIVAAQFPDNISSAFGTLEIFLGVGLISGPTLGGALYDLGGFGLPFYVVGFLLTVDAFLIFLILPNPGRSNGNTKGQLLKFWMHPSTLIHATAIFTSLNYIGFNQATLEPHIREFNLSGLNMGLVFALSAISYAISAPIWGRLCDKKCNMQVIAIFGYLLITSSLILTGPMPFLNLKNGIVTTVMAQILMGLAVGALIVSAFSDSLRETEVRGFPPNDLSTYALTSSMLASSQSLGAFIGPSIGGYLVENKGYDAGTVVVLMITLVSFFFLLLYTFIYKPMARNKEESMEKKPILGMNHISCNGET